MSLKDIKGKIKSVERTRKVTKAMEAVSAVKMRKSQDRALHGRPYANAALSILERLCPSLDSVNHPLMQKRETKRIALVVITSDKGLCGVLNTAVLKEAEKVVRDLGLPKEHIDIYTFGRKAAEYFQKRGYAYKEKHENVSDEVSVSDLSAISDLLVNGFMVGAFDEAHLVYTHFKSTFEQTPKAIQVLPLSIPSLRIMVEGIIPEKGAHSDAVKTAAPSFYTVEPSPEEVLDALIPKLVGIIVYHALLEAKASEHSARMVAMKNASDKSKEVSRSLTIQYNKARQALITREVSEIVGGIEAMAAS